MCPMCAALFGLMLVCSTMTFSDSCRSPRNSASSVSLRCLFSDLSLSSIPTLAQNAPRSKNTFKYPAPATSIRATPGTAGKPLAISCAICRGARFSLFANSKHTGEAASPISDFGGFSSAAEQSDATQLIALANTPGPALHEAITSTFDAKDLKEGTAWAARGSDFFFALQSISRPQLFIDAAPGPQMQPLAGTTIWYAGARIEQLGRVHSFHYLLAGNKFGVKLY